MNERADLGRLTIDRGTTRTSRARKRGWIGRIVVLVVIAAVAWVFRAKLLDLVDRVSLPVVRTARVVERSAAAAGGAAGAGGTSANGYVVARTRAALSADTPGRIVEMFVEEGTVVRRGDLVARLYDEEYRAALARAEADTRFSEAAVVTATSEREARNAELTRLRASVTASQADLEEANAVRELARLSFKRFERLVAEGVETVSRLDEVRQDLEAKEARVRALEARVEEDRAALIEGERRLDIAAASLLEAQAKVDVMRATRDEARATLEKTEVRAPFDGIVVLKDAEVGEVVSPNSQGGNSRGSVATMVDFDSLEVQADVPETSLAVVRVDGPARIYLDAYPNDPYAGRVNRIWPTADRQTATVEVRVVFERHDERLRPEMGVRVVFLDEEEGASTEQDRAAASAPVVLVPAAAVVERDGRRVAFVVSGERLALRALDLGDALGERLVVNSGVSSGEIVVLDPPSRLADGARVRVRDER